jgi:lysophospholipase L1-like esterase
MDVAAKVDIYDGNDAPQFAWLFVGDSITANGMSHSEISGLAGDSFGNQVEKISGRVPVQENAGMPGWLSGDAKAHLPIWLATFPGRYVTLNFGTNDGAGVDPQVFYANMSSLAEQTIARGKVPVVPLIPWASRPDLLKSIPALNAEIRRLLASQRCAIAGPDLYAYFKTHPELISNDGVHPSDAGYAELRKLWAQFAANIPNRPSGCMNPVAQ